MLKFILLLSISLVLLSGYQAATAQEASTPGTTYILDIAWSPDGTRLAAVGAYPGTSTEKSSLPDDAHGYLSVIDGLSGSSIFITEPPSAFTSVVWSPDGKRLALGSFDSTVWIVDAATGERITNLFGHQSTVTDVDWSSDGTQIISSGNWDELVILWDAINYTPLSQWETSAHPNAIAFGVTDQTITIGTEGGLYEFPLDMEPNSRISIDYRIIREWILDFAYSRDGHYIATGTIAHVRSTGVRDNARISIYDLITQTLTHQFESTLGSIGGLSWSVDNRYLAVLNEDDVMTLWDVEAGVITETYPSFGSDRYNKGGVAYSLYGGRLALGNWLKPDAALLSENVRVLGGGAVQVVVPAPSLDRLNSIAQRCVQDAASAERAAPLTRQPVTESTLPDFVATIETLAEGVIPPACAADLIAVAEAIQSR